MYSAMQRLHCIFARLVSTQRNISNVFISEPGGMAFSCFSHPTLHNGPDGSEHTQNKNSRYSDGDKWAGAASTKPSGRPRLPTLKGTRRKPHRAEPIYEKGFTLGKPKDTQKETSKQRHQLGVAGLAVRPPMHNSDTVYKKQL